MTYIQVSVMLLKVTLVTLVTLVTSKDTRPGEVEEFCQNEIFEANCGPSDVIVVSEARYGRMRQCRCIKKNYGYLGCQADVLGTADAMCSGRHDCSIRVPNSELDKAKTECPEDFKSYFEVQYTCQQVASPLLGDCRSGSTTLLTEPTGVISNTVTMETGCGSQHSPWVVRAQPGQRIRFWLLDFAYGSKNNRADHTQCYAYASLREDSAADRTSTICGGRVRTTDQPEYTSVGSEVQVIIFGKGTGSDADSGRTTRFFLLKYEVVGCPDPVDFRNGEYRRQGETLELTCNGSEETFTATCNGTTWSSDVDICTTSAASHSSGSGSLGFAMSYEIAIVIILAIALIIASTILCMGILCMRKAREGRARQVPPRMYAEHVPYPPPSASDVEARKSDLYPQRRLLSYEQYRSPGENLYASIQESSLPPPPHYPAGWCPEGDCIKVTVPGDMCSCSRRPDPRDCGTGSSGPYSSLECGAGAVPPEPISPTSRSECSSICRESGRPYYVLDPKDTDID